MTKLDMRGRKITQCTPAQEAAAQNELKRSAESTQSVLSRMQAARPGSGGAAGPPLARVSELTPAEAAKEEGNAAMKRGDVTQARRRRAGAEVSGLCRACCSSAILPLHLLIAHSGWAGALACKEGLGITDKVL